MPCTRDGVLETPGPASTPGLLAVSASSLLTGGGRAAFSASDTDSSLCPQGRAGAEEGPSFAQKTHRTPSHQTGAPAFTESLKTEPGQRMCQLGPGPRGLTPVYGQEVVFLAGAWVPRSTDQNRLKMVIYNLYVVKKVLLRKREKKKERKRVRERPGEKKIRKKKKHPSPPSPQVPNSGCCPSILPWAGWGAGST